MSCSSWVPYPELSFLRPITKPSIDRTQWESYLYQSFRKVSKEVMQERLKAAREAVARARAALDLAKQDVARAEAVAKADELAKQVA